MDEQNLDIPPPAPQFPCPICSRTFRKEALERHEKICQKSQAKKRKIYDSSKKRIEGTEITTVLKPKAIEKSTARKVEKPKSDWRAKHEEFIRAIRAAKGVETEENNEGPSTQQRVPIGYVCCPTCGRNFNERAADRHMPWCKEQKARNSKSPTIKDASDRLKARTKYRAPPLTKKDANSSSNSARSEKKIPVEKYYEAPPPPAPVVTNQRNQKVASKNNKPDNNNNNKNTQPQRKNPQQQLLDKRRTKPKEVESRISTHHQPTRTNNNNINSNIMKFKERFPNHKHRNIMTDENYEGFQEDLRELLRQNKSFSREPRTVPGVRTQGNNTNNNNNKLDELTSNFKNLGVGEFDINWAKKYHNWESNGSTDGLPQIGSSETTDPWAPIIQDLANTRVSTGESSTSSDGTLPPISRASSGSEVGGRLPRFCHQCGTKYPVQGAKYCCECGARRLAHGSGSTENSIILLHTTA